MIGVKPGFSRTLFVFLAPASAAFIQVLYFHILNVGELGLGFPIDDAYIFRQYVENLAAGHGFVFNPGETSFGGTSLAWPVLASALLRLFGRPPYVPAVFWLGGALFMLATVLTVSVVKRMAGTELPALVAGLMAACSPLLFMNAISGMETPLTMVLLAAFAAVSLKDLPRPALAGTVAGLYTLNRPEGMYFPLGFTLAWLMVFVLKKERLRTKDVFAFLVAWTVMTVPAAIWIYAETGSPLPTTYMGKIMSISPGELERGLVDRTGTALFYLAAGWIKLSLRLRALAALLTLGVIWEIGRALYGLRHDEAMMPWPLTGRLVLAGYLFLPAGYGFSFPVGPEFGGYYLRYIAPVLLPAVFLGVSGLVSIARLLREKIKPLRAWYRPAVGIAALLALSYLGWLWSFQIAYARADFKKEVRLNTGLRMKAARWIKGNTDPEARIMAGYTGLGVIGACSDRYVLDQGALINPDIFEYYKKAGPHPRKKWKMVVKYMHDKNMDYYVTFAFPPELARIYPDPADTPGFREVKRLGEPGKPQQRLSQVRIYKVDRQKRERNN
ncbi:MAG: hypothetical protein R6V10_12000 [bacterium]